MAKNKAKNCPYSSIHEITFKLVIPKLLSCCCENNSVNSVNSVNSKPSDYCLVGDPVALFSTTNSYSPSITNIDYLGSRDVNYADIKHLCCWTWSFSCQFLLLICAVLN